MNRLEAARVGAKTYDGIGPCKYGHAPVRVVSTGQCLACEEERKGAIKESRQRMRANKRAAIIERGQGLKRFECVADIRDIETLRACADALWAARLPIRQAEQAP